MEKMTEAILVALQESDSFLGLWLEYFSRANSILKVRFWIRIRTGIHLIADEDLYPLSSLSKKCFNFVKEHKKKSLKIL
jgi:hypothetical protein